VENYTNLHLVGCLDGKKPQVPSELEQQYPEDEDEVLSFVSFLKRTQFAPPFLYCMYLCINPQKLYRTQQVYEGSDEVTKLGCLRDPNCHLPREQQRYGGWVEREMADLVVVPT
ncbi:hypothetical protein H5410_036612, partial [Solanum commersonii]